MFKKILVAVDESEIDEEIIKATLNIAHNNQSIITLINVNKEDITRGLTYVPKNYLEETLTQLEQESLDKLKKVKDKLTSENGVTVEMVPVKGDPAYQILEYAESNDQDLIIMGSRGFTGMKGVMLGSVSHKVTQLSKCPVLIVH